MDYLTECAVGAILNLTMNLSTFDINEFNNQIIPLTYFRRNAGQVFERLARTKQLLITKDGVPLAIISDLSTPSASKTGIKSTAGIWKDRKNLKNIERQYSRYGQIFS
jgi:hypothetical protein